MSAMIRKLSIGLLAGVGVAAVSAAAMAAPAVGLVGDKTLIWFDTSTGEITNTAEVEGVDRLLGIDVRPADTMLYGVDDAGAIVTIDLETGVATAGATMGEMLDDGVVVSVNFNPVADRLRVMGSDGANLRIHPDTGETTVDGSLHFAADDANAGGRPDIVATAYTNGLGSPETTAMYDIDATLGALIRQTAPNDGTLATIGTLGVDADHYALDFEVRAIDDNIAWMAAGGRLYTIDLETGEAVMEAEFVGLDGDLRDISILPSM